MLTDLAIRNLKPQDRAYEAADRDGMYVVVSLTGNKTFRFDYRFKVAAKPSRSGAIRRSR